MKPDHSDIFDPNSLYRWARDQDRKCVAQIAYRISMRVVPIWGAAMEEDWAKVQDLSVLPGMRMLLTAAVNSHFTGLEIKPAQDSAVTRVAFSVSGKTPKTAKNVGFVAYAVNYAVPGEVESVLGAAFGATPTEGFWDAIRHDALCVELRNDLEQEPLWPGSPPDWFVVSDETARKIWQKEPEAWHFWNRWWDAIVKGIPLSWDLQRDVALIPEDIWAKGAEAVGVEIAKIEDRYAIAATDNAEVIEPNPETGKLRLVPTSTLPLDLGGYARRKMLKAAELFDEPAARQQYGAIGPDLAMLRAAVADAGNLPVELYDACASASLRLTIRAGGGECPSPEKDPLLSDYRDRLVDVSADILAHDPMTQDVLDRRNRIKGNNALIEGGATISLAVQIVLPATEGRLADTLSLDGQLATDPQADPELRKAASVRLTGRMLRLIKWVGATAAAEALLRGGYWILENLGPAAVETLKSAWQIFLSWLGF